MVPACPPSSEPRIIGSVAAYCLSFHAAYRCERSGACCTAGWPIPIEPARVSVLQARGILARAAAVVEENGAPALVVKNANGSCVFYDADHSGLCAIHRDGGPHLMPSACRNFPRVSLRDARGVFVTLSHYCPTAAGLLVDARYIAIVPAPASLSLDGDAEGLDATAVMPPLLRRGMLMDFDGYAAWEQEAIAVFDAFDRSPRLASA